MIGGYDIIIPTNAGEDALDCALRAARRVWPQMVVDDADTGERIGRYEDVNFSGLHEVFAYQDSGVADLWAKRGPVAGLEDRGIHLIVTADELTIVVQAKGAACTGQIVRMTEGLLRSDLLNTPATLRREAA